MKRRVWGVIGVVIALFPWFGFAVRFLTKEPGKLVLAGGLLWMAGIGGMGYIFRVAGPIKNRSYASSALIWTLQFVPIYVATVLLMGAILNR
jgi:hypothetical protein